MIFALAGLIVVMILVALFSNPDARHCRWREDRRRVVAAGERFYVCAACGAQAVTTTGKPPRDCRRAGANPPR